MTEQLSAVEAMRRVVPAAGQTRTARELRVAALGLAPNLSRSALDSAIYVLAKPENGPPHPTYRLTRVRFGVYRSLADHEMTVSYRNGWTS